MRDDCVLSEASKRAGVERTHEREDVARLVPAPAREVLAPADQVTHLDFEGPFLAEAVGAEAVAVDEGVVLPELGDKLLQVGDRLCVVDLAAEARCIGPTGRLAAVDGDRVDGLLAAAVGRERRKWSARESRTLVCAGEQARRTPASKLFILGGVCGLPWPCATICRAPRGRETRKRAARDWASRRVRRNLSRRVASCRRAHSARAAYARGGTHLCAIGYSLAVQSLFRQHPSRNGLGRRSGHFQNRRKLFMSHFA